MADDNLTVENLDPSNDEEKAWSNWLQSQFLEAKDRRHSIVQIASRMVESLHSEGKVRRLPRDPSRELSLAPEGIPAIGWTETESSVQAEKQEHYDVNLVGNLGEYYSSRFYNQCPADTFNIGFYVGVLAVKEGLVDPELFEKDRPKGTDK